MNGHDEPSNDKVLSGASVESYDESQPLLSAPPHSLRRREARYGSRDGAGDPGNDIDHDADAEDLKTTLWQDLCWSASRGWWAGLLGVVVALFISHRVLIAPYPFVRPILTPEQMSMDSLRYVRPVLSEAAMAKIHECTMYAETTFHLPAEFSAQGLPEYLQQSEGPGWATAEGADGQIYRATKRNKKHKKEKNQGSYAPGVTSVQLRFHSSVSKHGNFPPPDVFYAGVVFGITWENSHALEYYKPAASMHEVEQIVLSMEPRPTSVFRRSSSNAVTGWQEAGLAVYFSNADLKAQGWLSSDRARPWKRTEEPILEIARNLKLIYVVEWFPHAFGVVDPAHPHKHEVVIQQVVPTRTGLDPIKSSVTVWLTAVNGSQPLLPPRIARHREEGFDQADD